MKNTPHNLIEVELATQVIKAHTLVTPDQFDSIFRANTKMALPVSIIVGCSQPPIPAGANISSQTRLKVRWGDGKCGDEVLLDAAHCQTLTVGGSTFEVLGCHRSQTPAGALGPDVTISVTIFPGFIQHVPPVLSEKLTVNAGATSPKLQIPPFTKTVRVYGEPFSVTLALHGYADGNLGAASRLEIQGQEGLPVCNDIQYVAVQNFGIVNKAVLVVYELGL